MPGCRSEHAADPRILEILREASSELVDLVASRPRIKLGPFTVAVRRYQVHGDPPEIGQRWRHALDRPGDLRLFAKLSRDLASALAPLPRTTEMIAGPFASAEHLDAFTDAVAVLRGLRHASVELFGAGSAVVHVSYDDADALTAHVAGLLPLADTVLVGTPAVLPWLEERDVIEAA